MCEHPLQLDSFWWTVWNTVNIFSGGEEMTGVDVGALYANAFSCFICARAASCISHGAKIMQVRAYFVHSPYRSHFTHNISHWYCIIFSSSSSSSFFIFNSFTLTITTALLFPLSSDQSTRSLPSLIHLHLSTLRSLHAFSYSQRPRQAP